MSPDEVLICSTCHQEARVVRVGKSLLVLGHLRLRGPSHPVKLAHQCADCGDLLPRKGNHPRERCQRCHHKALPGLVRTRFWAKLERPDGPAGCWIWPGKVDRDGYGYRRPHRLAYIYTNGPIPDGLVVRHTCDVPRCCNPAHLLVGTQADNIADREARGRTARGDRSGARLHPERFRRGSAAPRARLTESQVATIQRRLADGITHRALAAEFGVARTTITAINRGNNWSHLTLSRSADERGQVREDARRQSRVRAPHLTTTGTRPASKGSAPDRLSSGAPSGARGA